MRTPEGEQLHVDGGPRTAWIRLRSPRATFVRVRIADTEDGFELLAAALPVPRMGLLIGSLLAAAFLVEITGPSVFVLPALAFLLVAIGARSVYVGASARLEAIADAMVTHVAASQQRAEITPGSPSPEIRETPSTPPPEERVRRSSSSD